MSGTVDNTRLLILFLLIYGVHLTGHFIDIMDVDAAHYAAISVEMMQSDNWLEVYMRGGDYLDKPPLLFWISALSFKWFGVGNFTYRLFPVLISFLGIFATYRLSRLYYSKQISTYAAVIFATSQAVFLMNHDIRTDNLLTTFIVIAVWQLLAFVQTGKNRHAFLGSTAIGLAMLAKGPIGLIAPVMVVGIQLLLTRQLRLVWRWQWLVGIGIIILILLPMSIGLYQQFDAHPEKVVNGQTGVSGLKFFYWTQSFGRITGESVWDNDPGPFFQLNAFLWSFLPWTIFGLVAYVQGFKALIHSKFKLSPLEDGFSIAGVTLIFVVMSMSSYQLPHYTYPAYPFIAIFTANWLDKLLSESHSIWSTWMVRIQILLLVILAVGTSVTVFLLWQTTSTLILGSLLLAIILISIYVIKWSKLHRLIAYTLVTILSVNLMLNLQFYPFITNFQSGSQAGKYISVLSVKPTTLYTFLEGPMSLDFYSGLSTQGVPAATDFFEFDDGEYIVFTSMAGFEELKSLGMQVAVMESFKNYPITELSPDFLFKDEIRQNLPYNCLVRLTVDKKK
jgi:hypothetical protein